MNIKHSYITYVIIMKGVIKQLSAYSGGIFSGGIAQSVTCWAVNPQVQGLFPARDLEISEILFVVFPDISDRVDRINIWLKVPGSCVSIRNKS